MDSEQLQLALIQGISVSMIKWLKYRIEKMMYIDKTAEKISINLKRIRAERSLTQFEVAELADLNANSYAKIERGESRPEIETLEKLAKALKVKASDILSF